MKTEAQMRALTQTFQDLYVAVQNEDPAGVTKQSTTLIVAASGGSNPIRDVPPNGLPQLTDPDAVLARAEEFNVTWEGGNSVFGPTRLADVAKARKQSAAWCGEVLDLGLIDLNGPSFYAGASLEARKGEALRRWSWLHQAKTPLLRYLAATGWMGFDRMNPEPGMFTGTPCDGENEFAGMGLAEFIAEMQRRKAAGSVSGK